MTTIAVDVYVIIKLSTNSFKYVLKKNINK